MHRAHVLQLQLLDGLIEKTKKAAAGRHRCCVLMGTGHGDHMRGVAFCQAIKALHSDWHVFALWHWSGAAWVGLDLMHSAEKMGAVDAHAPSQDVPRRMLVGWLAERFDRVYDAIPYAVGELCQDRREQVEAMRRLLPFHDLYAGHPTSTWRVKHEPYSQWEMMSVTSGIPVSEEDLVPPARCAGLPEDLALAGLEGRIPVKDLQGALEATAGETDWKKAAIVGHRYVVVHNAAGRGSAVKEDRPAKEQPAGAPIFKAVVSRLAADGVKCVQVGGPDDELMEGAIDRRGTRTPLVYRLLVRSHGFVSIEGFLPYLGRAAAQTGVVCFGPTPAPFFGMEANVNLLNHADGRVACPIGSCFWGGGFTAGEQWGRQCCIGEGNPQFPRCANLPTPLVVADAAAAMVKRYDLERADESAALGGTEPEPARTA